VFVRGAPWTRLILREGSLPDDLNLALSQRIAAVLALVSSLTLTAAVAGLAPLLLTAIAVVSVAAVVAVNRDQLRWFSRIRGLSFAVRGMGMQLLYYHYSVLAFSLGVAGHLLEWRSRATARKAAQGPAPGSDFA